MDYSLKDVFKFCPLCGRHEEVVGKRPFHCPCGFVFFFPPTVAVGAVIADLKGRVLLIERAKDPGKGKLGMPGGFVDAGETAEQAVAREVKEEVGLEVKQLTYLTTYPNLYHYSGIVSDILDIFFICKVENFDELLIEPREVKSYTFAKPGEAIFSRMAFESNKKALELFDRQEVEKFD